MAKCSGSATLATSLAAELNKLCHSTSVLGLDNLDELACRSFPPCMARVLAALRRDHWATFKGRFELALFMKALGLDYFAQHNFWKAALRRATPEDEWHFQSQVVLVLRQMYGLDDAEDDYAPHRCVCIVNHDAPPKKTMVQGCPFAALPKAELKVFLKTLRRGVAHADIEELTQFVPDRPAAACVAFFNGTFGDVPFKGDAFERPVDYFNESEWRMRNR
jgi:DNA primase large subunit